MYLGPLVISCFLVLGGVRRLVETLTHAPDAWWSGLRAGAPIVIAAVLFAL